MSLVIGIDPDVDKVGVAVMDKQNKTITAYSLKFFELLDFLRERREQIEWVKVECGFLIAKSNYHRLSPKAVSENIAKKVGRNHQSAYYIIEMCEYLGLSTLKKKPLRKIWKGVDKKITQEELEFNLKAIGYTFKGRKNQDARDAALIALY